MQLPDHSGRPMQATKESDLASACQSAHPTRHYDKRSVSSPPFWLETCALSRAGCAFPPVWWETYATSRASRAFPPVWWQTYAPSRPD
jgi:hypothetical protein